MVSLRPDWPILLSSANSRAWAASRTLKSKETKWVCVILVELIGLLLRWHFLFSSGLKNFHLVMLKITRYFQCRPFLHLYCVCVCVVGTSRQRSCHLLANISSKGGLYLSRPRRSGSITQCMAASWLHPAHTHVHGHTIREKCDYRRSPIASFMCSHKNHTAVI